MPKQTSKSDNVLVIKDISQQNIIQNRRKLREQMLKQIGQRTSITEHNIEQLAKLTR
ncbi:hypothetical protein [Paenibacillus sp. PL91]|uniref:hypothetical protein n=1 Tax=Paenibacillus sp. PL91 TaxID=2729538 RepID=UPI00145CA777|nr:hypothetical protein [Paenibacillus sp. PL91]MBC9204101.1 hypothetical protein [Paenibacillus sp. PL91]